MLVYKVSTSSDLYSTLKHGRSGGYTERQSLHTIESFVGGDRSHLLRFIIEYDLLVGVSKVEGGEYRATSH